MIAFLFIHLYWKELAKVGFVQSHSGQGDLLYRHVVAKFRQSWRAQKLFATLNAQQLPESQCV